MEEKLLNIALKKATDTKSVIIGSGILSTVVSIFSQLFNNEPVIVIADENTFDIAGKYVYQHFSSNWHQPVFQYLFPNQPILYADFTNVLKLEEALREHDAIPVVVGSGTLNDITKLAAFNCNRPYMVIGTAASMDGYASFGAAITKDGFKQTMSCPAPRAIVVDLDIVVNAPLLMTASGYADLLGKITSGADWLIADFLEIDPIDNYAWSLVQHSLREWIGDPSLLRCKDKLAICNLVEGLIMSGLAMQAINSSRPASGSEHQFSHYWEMQEVQHGKISHGFKVGLGSIASAALYESVLKTDLGKIDINSICSRWPTTFQLEKQIRADFPNPIMAEKAVEQSLQKYVNSEHLRKRLGLLKNRWPQLKKQLNDQLLTANQIKHYLHEAGCPTHPSMIGKKLLSLKSDYFNARRIRSRYTIFDLAAETGYFEKCVEELFGQGGFWTSDDIQGANETV